MRLSDFITRAKKQFPDCIIQPPATAEDILTAQARLNVILPEQVVKFYQTCNGICFPDPFLEILPLDQLQFINDKSYLKFCKVNEGEEICFDTSSLNEAAQWFIKGASEDYTITYTMVSFWSNKIWTWIEKQRPMWTSVLDIKIKVVHSINEVRQAVAAARAENKRIGFVPTMGALHAGHGSLIEAAVSECDYVVVSIFVNPTQFGPSEDLDKYPRTLDADAALCEKLGADLIFAPSADQMYPVEQLTWVNTEKLTDTLCGASRPGHFRGVTTVCTKLFNIIRPDIACFGQKDAQQALVIRRMVADLNMPLEIKICPIVREPDGLAMSSRNRYLSPDERQRALCLYKVLIACRQKIEKGETSAKALIAEMQKIIDESNGQADYISIVDPQTLEPIEQIKDKALIALAVKIGQTRLIDNMIIE